MANSFKFKGVALATTNETALLTAASDETIIIKSIRVTNNTSNTPTLSFDVSDSSASAEYTILKTQTLAANTAVDEFQFKFPNGNIDSGDICLYGIK